MSGPDIRITMFLPPDDTLRVWDQRGELRTTVRWAEMINEDHATAFTVAKVAQLDLLREIRASLDETMRSGGTFESWKAALVPQLQKAGWWGLVTDPALTGTDQPVLVNERRLKTIFRTNVRMSQSAAAWLKIQQEKDLFPFLRYLSDHFRKEPREDHRSWHGLILPVDHPWWLTNFPPNGWGCRCHFEQVSEDRMKRNGWKVGTPPDDGPDTLFRAAGRKAPLRVPAGVEPGFGYNPGVAHLRAVATKTIASVEEAVASGLELPARRMIEQIVTDPAFAQFRALPDQPFPVQLLMADEAAAIGARARMVMLSRARMEPPDARQQDLPDADYRNLPSILAGPDLIEQQAPGRTAFYRSIDGRWYRAAVEVAAGGDEIWLLHLQRLRDAEMRRLRRRRIMLEGWLALIALVAGAR